MNSYLTQLSALIEHSIERTQAATAKRESAVTSYLLQFEDAWARQSNPGRLSVHERREIESELAELEELQTEIESEYFVTLDLIAEEDEQACAELDERYGLPEGQTIQSMQSDERWQNATTEEYQDGPADDYDEDDDDNHEDHYGYAGGWQEHRQEGSERLFGENSGFNTSASSASRVKARHEAAWKALPQLSSTRSLCWTDIPWPVLAQAPSVGQLTPENVTAFFAGESRKEKRDAMLRWHPDRFEGRWLELCVAEERQSVKQSVGVVARCLSGMLEERE